MAEHRHVAVGELSCGVGHAVEDEAMMPRTGMGVAEAQPLQNNQWLLQLFCETHRVFEGMIVPCASVCQHPVEHVAPIGADRMRGRVGDSGGSGSG